MSLFLKSSAINFLVSWYLYYLIGICFLSFQLFVCLQVVKTEVGVGASMPNPLAEGDEWTPPGMVVSESTPTLTQSNKRPLSDSTETTPSSVERPGKRQRKEKKIFDL